MNETRFIPKTVTFEKCKIRILEKMFVTRFPQIYTRDAIIEYIKTDNILAFLEMTQFETDGQVG